MAASAIRAESALGQQSRVVVELAFDLTTLDAAGIEMQTQAIVRSLALTPNVLALSADCSDAQEVLACIRIEQPSEHELWVEIIDVQGAAHAERRLSAEANGFDEVALEELLQIVETSLRSLQHGVPLPEIEAATSTDSEPEPLPEPATANPGPAAADTPRSTPPPVREVGKPARDRPRAATRAPSLPAEFSLSAGYEMSFWGDGFWISGPRAGISFLRRVSTVRTGVGLTLWSALPATLSNAALDGSLWAGAARLTALVELPLRARFALLPGVGFSLQTLHVSAVAAEQTWQANAATTTTSLGFHVSLAARWDVTTWLVFSIEPVLELQTLAAHLGVVHGGTFQSLLSLNRLRPGAALYLGANL